MNLWTSARKQLKIISTISEFQALFHSLEHFIAIFQHLWWFFQRSRDMPICVPHLCGYCFEEAKLLNHLVVSPSVRPSVHVYHYNPCVSLHHRHPKFIIIEVQLMLTYHTQFKFIQTGWNSRSEDYQKIQEDTVDIFLIFLWLQAKNQSIAENLSTKGQGGNLILFTEFSSNWRIYEPWLTSGGDRGAWWNNWTQWNMLSSWAAH